MNSGLAVLSIGTPSDPNAASRALLRLHEEQPIERLLFAQGGALGALLAQGGHSLNKLPATGWAGHWAIRRGERPPCAGIDLVLAVLADAMEMSRRPEVVAWGPVFAFWDGRRVKEWDASHNDVVDQILRFGMTGWGWAGDRLVRLLP